MPQTNKKTIAKQLWREFWAPAGLAVYWVTYSFLLDEVNTWYLAAKAFGPAFFLASWGTAQLFRVSKQTRVESDLRALQEQTNTLLQNLETTAASLRDLATGGKSFCFLIFQNLSENNKALIKVEVVGDTPVYDVRFTVSNQDRMTELFEKHKDMQGFYKGRFERNLGSFRRSYIDFRDWPDLGDFPVHNFIVEWTARNTSYIQMYRMRNVNGRWSNRVAVRDDNLGVIFDLIDKDYPVELDKSASGDDWCGAFDLGEPITIVSEAIEDKHYSTWTLKHYVRKPPDQ